MHTGPPRLGAYLLAADPTWLRSSLLRYYDRLDALVISAAAANRGWTGRSVAADGTVEIAAAVDTRGIARVIRGDWSDRDQPMHAEIAQRQEAIEALSRDVDWILQVDSDEVLPSIDALLDVLEEAARLGIDAVEWPMRVLYRRLRDGRFLEIVNDDGTPHHEYPGPIAVRPGVRLSDARRTSGPFLRPVVVGDTSSLQVGRVAGDGEIRMEVVAPEHAILHNSWARSPRAVHRKVASWGHNDRLRSSRYFYATWLPAPLRWRRMRDLHPFAAGLWPRLGVVEEDPAPLLDPVDRGVAGQTKRFA